MTADQSIEAMVREHHGRLVAALTNRFRDIALAEDALQDALVEAITRWPKSGYPPSPPAWLMTVATRKAIDRLRRQNLDTDKLGQLATDLELTQPDEELQQEASIPDHRLRLIFSCCHPSIDIKNRSALVLKVVCGLSTAQISQAYLVAETTMAQRLVRTKSKIRKSGIPFEVPPADRLADRLADVLEVIYLIFNAGYQTSEGDVLVDHGLCEEALYLGKLMVTLMPQQTEAVGLVALMIFHHARRDARIDCDGELVVLEKQNRDLWHTGEIAFADRMLKAALMQGKPGRYQIQAAISAVHCHAVNFESTDWPQILLLYHQLELYDDSPVVKINLAVALSFARDADIALCYLDRLEGLDRLSAYHPYFVVRADLLQRTGNITAAAGMLDKAISLTRNKAEQAFLGKKKAALSG